MITKDELQHWLSVCDAATEGPWSNCYDGVPVDHSVYSDTDEDNTCVATTWGVAHGVTPEQAQSDAAFIAIARTALPRAIARIQELESEVERLRAQIDTCGFKRIHEQLAWALSEHDELNQRLAGMTGERDDERRISQEWESKHDDLQDQLAAALKAKDEACDLAACGCPDSPRLAALRSIGKGGDRE